MPFESTFYKNIALIKFKKKKTVVKIEISL